MKNSCQILIIFIALNCCFCCQSARLPTAKIQRDPSPQLHYRYVNEARGFSFDFPYYGLRFFNRMDKKARILTRNLSIYPKNVLLYQSEYLSNHARLMVVLYEKPLKSSTIIAAHLKRLQSKKTFSNVAFTANPTVKIDPKETIIINNYEVKLDSNIALAEIKYHAQLDNADFLCVEYYVELRDKSLLRFINFVNIDPALFDESDRAVDSSWFYGHKAHYNLAYFKQPIPPLDLTGDVPFPPKMAKNVSENAHNNGYLEPLAALHKDSILYDTVRPEFKSAFYQTLMAHYAMAGFSEEAYAMRDTALGVSRLDSCNSLVVKDLDVGNAINFISRNLSNRRLLMLDERHHLPLCRLFAVHLLDSLKKNGFRYLALEALNFDHKIAKNGFPTKDDGFYSQEPMFAELIRQAVDRGFKIVGYNDSSECMPPPDAHRFYCSNLKEEKAAERIATIFNKDPKAKVFIYSETDQNYKDYFVAQRQRRAGHKFKFLAMYLKDKLGFDPLSINQSDMVERSIPAYENPLYRCVRLQFSPEKSVVLVKKDGKSWTKPDFETLLDAYVFHPRTNRETPYEWLEQVGFKQYDLDVSDVKDGYLVQVFYKNELDKVGKKAIPALNLPMREEKKLALWLRPNTAYTIRFYAKDSRLLKEMPFH